MPGVGLYLPETLHRNNAQTSKQTEVVKKVSKQLSREAKRSSHDTNDSASKRSIDQQSILAEVTTNTFKSIDTAFEYADFVLASRKRSSDAGVLASLVWHIQQDLMEASRLYLTPTTTSFFDAWPDKKAWIDEVLLGIRKALNDLGSYIESIQFSRDDGESSGLKRRFEYILNRQKRLSAKHQMLSTRHQILMGAISVMQTVELCSVSGSLTKDPIFEAPGRSWHSSENSRGPYSRRSGSKNLSLSSVGPKPTDTFDGMCSSCSFYRFMSLISC